MDATSRASHLAGMTVNRILSQQDPPHKPNGEELLKAIGFSGRRQMVNNRSVLKYMRIVSHEDTTPEKPMVKSKEVAATM